MNEYTIIENATKEQRIIFGYNWNDALRRAKLQDAEVTMLDWAYVD